ncbi:trypsin-like peptidase domain-containing protein [Streptomyces sp. NPDC012888]|uniref:nSTAND1 domain-containing NTPase n=1 Tax=Streptomyces sp. NPDC012888 TaxID=3364855 RepID=UPI0036C57A40
MEPRDDLPNDAGPVPAPAPSDPAAPRDASVARVLNADGVPEGAGFRAGQNEVITCAHVVARVLGVPDDTEAAPDGRLWVDFPLAAPGARVPAEVRSWSPVRADGSGDIAVLALLADPPARAPVARLVEADGTDRRVRSFGFPRDHDDGAWSVGWLRGATGAGWYQYDTDPASQHRVELGFSGAPVWDVAEGGVVGMVVGADRRPDVRTGYVIPTATLRAQWSTLAETALPACPFRSLEPFEERDGDVFHGRDEPARRVADLLRHAPAVTLVGPSGCGKSSLLHAGVLPLLRQREELEIAVFRPGRVGRTPLDALALALLPRLEPELTETARLAGLPALTGLLRDGGLPAVADRLLARQGKDRLLLVADQFEEALTGAGPAEQDELAAALGHCLDPGSRVRVLAALRADFLTPALAHPGLAGLLSGDRLFTVGAMSDQELRAAVERPLGSTGVAYEPGLVDRILGDLGSDPARLPLLEFTLTQLWERQRHGRIGHDAYESLGRVHDALATHAEQIWTGALSEPERAAARGLLVQLVHPGDEGTEPTRRTLARSELRPEQWRLAQRLMTTRLLVPGEDYRPGAGPPQETVELAHETLLTHWPRLRRFVEQDRAFRTWQEGLRRRIAEWSADPRPARRLLRGQDLRDARGWSRARPQDLRPAESEFIAASGRGARRRLTALTALGLVLALLVGGGSWLWREDVRDDAAARAADVLVQQSRDMRALALTGDPGMAYSELLLALRAYRTHDNPRTRARLAEMHAQYGFADLIAPNYLQRATASMSLIPHTPSNADGEAKVVASRNGAGELVLVRAEGDGVRRTATGRRADVMGVSPDGTMVALAGNVLPTPAEVAEGTFTAPDPAVLAPRLYDVATGRFRDLQPPEGGDPPPDIGGELLPGVEMPEFPEIPGLTMPTQFARFAFSPDSKTLLGLTGILGQGGRLVLWDVPGGTIRKVMPGLKDAVDALWLDTGGTRMITVSTRTVSFTEHTLVLHVWDLTGAAPAPREVAALPARDDGTVHLDVSPDLTRFATLESGFRTEGRNPVFTHRVALHELPGGRLLREERSGQAVVTAGLAVGPGGSPLLPYSLVERKVPGRPDPPSPGPGPVRPVGGAETWSAVDLTGPQGRPVVVLHSLGLMAVVRDAGGDPLGRIPAEAAAPDPDPPAAAARKWMDRFCRVLGDETLPPALAGEWPPGTYRGPLCEERKGTRG